MSFDLFYWSKAIHFMAFAAWMAGLWYLPRLYVYHTQVPVGSEASEKFKLMERRLLKAITTPAMLVSFVAGLTLAYAGDNLGAGWFHAKLTLLILMGGFHGLMAADLKKFARDERPRSETTYRALNEVPTVLFVLIVILAVFRPF